MRIAISIFFLLSCFALSAQITYAGRVIKSPQDADEAAPLAQILTAKCKTEREKVTVIFDWITQNISYQIRPGAYQKKTSKYEVEDPSDTATVLKPLDERVADLVIRRKEAFCDGYARLFKTLCNFSGVSAEVISGFSRTNTDNGKFRSNHTWNAVRIDSQWHLLDVTWASGFITFSSNEYIQRYNDYYFLTEPGLFINDHYPEDLKWTLLPQPPNYREYNSSPFKQQGFIKNQVTSFLPEKGVITAIQGDTLHFELSTNFRKAENGLHMDTALLADDETALQSFVNQEKIWENLKPSSLLPGKILFTYVVTSNKIGYLNLTLNDHPMLRYRLNVLRPSAQMAANK